MNTILQYMEGGRNRLKMKVNINENVIPDTIPIWFQGPKEEDISIGENYLMYNGVTELIIPDIRPCKHRAMNNILISGIMINIQEKIIPIDKIEKHYFLLNFLIRNEVQKPPKPPIYYLSAK
jgi:hypothetical protein